MSKLFVCGSKRGGGINPTNIFLYLSMIYQNAPPPHRIPRYYFHFLKLFGAYSDNFVKYFFKIGTKTTDNPDIGF